MSLPLNFAGSPLIGQAYAAPAYFPIRAVVSF
jgi:K+-transporting ATPase c subunit